MENKPVKDEDDFHLETNRQPPKTISLLDVCHGNLLNKKE